MLSTSSSVTSGAGHCGSFLSPAAATVGVSIVTEEILLVGVDEIVGFNEGAGFVKETERESEMKAGFDFKVDVDVAVEVNAVAGTDEAEENEVKFKSGVIE